MTADLTRGIVRILARDGTTAGTGFVVTDEGLIATCAHVVEGAQPHVAFPDGELCPAQVVAIDEVHDVAILRVEGDLPPGAAPARLGRSADGRYCDFRSRGYRPLGGMEGIPAEGKVLDAVSECPGVQHKPLVLQTQHVRGGMSGAPVYVPDLDLVVGMITGYWDSLIAQTGFSDRDTALATPSEAIAALCPDLRLEDPLADYRRRVLEETRLVNLAGVPLPRDREGQPIPLEVPLDRVYIRIQAMPEEQRREEREAERRAVEEGAERGGLLRRLLSPRRKSPEARPHRPSPADVLAVLRTLGEYFYRRGEVYQAKERPEPVDPQAALKEKGRLVILGAPGAGKTTLLRYLARRAADDPRDPVPILVSLRDYAAHRGAGGQQTLQAFALERAGRGDTVQRRALEAALQAGEVLWLVDALDEARGWREEAAREVATLPGRLVLTSRPVGYERAGLERLPHFEVLPLAPQETDKFVRDWFGLLAERRGEGEDWIEARAAWLQSQIAERPRIAPLTRNPLLLTFLVVLAGEEPARDLPSHRAELYRRYVEELLATWEVRRHPREGAEGRPALRLGPLTGEEAQAAALDGFTRLGWRLHLIYYGGQGAALPVSEELRADLARALQPHWNLSKGEAAALAEAVLGFWEEAGLVDRWRLEGQEYLAFRHLTFQEYAAAKSLADLWEEDPQRGWRFLRPRLHHYAWREVVLLLAGLLRDATPLVRWVLKAGSPYNWELHQDLLLAAAIVGDGAPVAPDVVGRVTDHLTRLYLDVKVKWRHRLILPTSIWLILTAGLYRYGPVPCCLIPLGTLIWWWIWLLSVTGFLPRLQVVFTFPHRLSGRCAYASLREQVVNGLLGLPEPQRAQVMEHLIRALRGEEWRARGAAAWALGEIGDPQAVEPLIRALGNKKWRVRGTAAWALGEIGDPQAVEPLIQALGDENLDVRWEAAEALGKIGEPAVVSLIRALGNENLDVRWAAAKALGEIGDPQAVVPLIRALGDEEWRVRWEAAEALGKIGDPRAVEPLIRALGDKDWGMREAAAKALGEIGDPQAVVPLIRALGDENLDVREAAKALGKIGKPAVVPLIRALGDEEWRLREAAATALGEIGDPQAVASLIQALGDEEWRVREAAAEALGKIGKPAVVPLIRALGDEEWRVREAAAKALGEIGDPQAVASLIQALGDEEWRVREAAAEALGEIGDPQAVASLIQALGDEEWLVRTKAVKALGKIGDPQAVVPLHLIRALGDESRWVCWEAEFALLRIDDEKAYWVAAQALRHSDEDVRREAAEALGGIGDPQAVASLIQALGDEEWRVREAAAEALGGIGDPRAVEPLIRTLGDWSDDVRRAAAEALEKIGEPAVEALIRALRDWDRDVREAAAWGLGEIGEKIEDRGMARKVAQRLWWRLTDTDVANTACEALARVVARLTELEVAALPLQILLAPHSLLHGNDCSGGRPG